MQTTGALAITFGLFILPGSLLAGEVSRHPYTVQYEGDGECPSHVDFVAMVGKRSALGEYAPAAKVSYVLRVRLRTLGPQAHGWIWLPTSEEPRVVDGASCQTVAESLAFIGAMAVDAEGESAPAALRPELKPHVRPPSDMRLAVLGGLLWGTTPVALTGGRLQQDYESQGGRGLSVGWGASYFESGDVKVESGAARFRLMTLSGLGCLPKHGVRGWDGTACVGSEVGVIRAEGISGSGLVNTRSVVRPWAAVNVSLRGTISLSPRFRLESLVGGGWQVTDRSFIFESPREVISDPEPWVINLSVGASSSLL